jgi:hypothetical protein
MIAGDVFARPRCPRDAAVRDQDSIKPVHGE